MLDELAILDTEQVVIGRVSRYRIRINDREHEVAFRDKAAWFEHRPGFKLGGTGSSLNHILHPSLQACSAIANFRCVLRVVRGVDELAHAVEMPFHRHHLLEGLHERAICFGLIEIGDGSGTIDLCTAGGIRRRQRLLTSPQCSTILPCLKRNKSNATSGGRPSRPSYFQCTNTRSPSTNVR